MNNLDLLGPIPDADYWDTSDDTERLSHTDPSEAIEEWFDDLVLADGMTLEETVRAACGDELELYGWTRDTFDSESMAQDIIDRLSEQWSEEYGDPDGDDADFGNLTDKLKALLEEDAKSRNVWRCSNTVTVDIDVDALVLYLKAEWPEEFELSVSPTT